MNKVNSMKHLLSLIICVTISQFALQAQSTWTSLPPLTGSLYSLYFVNNQTGWAVGTAGVFKTTSGGFNWILQSSDSARGVCFINSSTGIIGGHSPKRTTDGGAAWINLSRFADTLVYDINRTDSMILFACGGLPASYGLIWRSIDAGLNWTRIYITQNTNYGNFRSVQFVNYNFGWACTNVLVYKTTNGGAGSASYFASSQSYYDIYFVDQNTGWLTNNTSTILKSTNGGLPAIPQPLPYSGGYALHFFNSSDGRIVGPNGIMRTVNGGSNWFIETSPTTEHLNAIFFTGNDTGYICGANGTILKTVNGGVVTNFQNTSSEIPKEFSLSQNFPNPFNPVTSIEFSLPDRSLVSLTVYDAMGREIEVLVKTELNPGTYRVRYDATKYSSGVYFYSLVSENFTETKKMIIVK